MTERTERKCREQKIACNSPDLLGEGGHVCVWGKHVGEQE